MTTMGKLPAAAKERAIIYKLLSECYYPPTDGLLQNLQGKVKGRNLAGIFGLAPEQGVELVDLQKEYARLFVGPFEVLAPPYGSVYLEEEKHVFGASTLDAKRWYAEDGLQMVSKELPDHVAIELEYAYLLSFREAKLQVAHRLEEAAECRNRLADFLQCHLAVWIPIFAQQISIHAQTDFYKQLASMTAAFIEQERAFSASLNRHVPNI